MTAEGCTPTTGCTCSCHNSGGLAVRHVAPCCGVTRHAPSTADRDRSSGTPENVLRDPHAAAVAEVLAAHEHILEGCACGWRLTAEDFGRWAEAYRAHLADALAGVIAAKQAEAVEAGIAEFEALASKVKPYGGGSILAYQISADDWRGVRATLRKGTER